jgi:hypothetical protein
MWNTLGASNLKDDDAAANKQVTVSSAEVDAEQFGGECSCIRPK